MKQRKKIGRRRRKGSGVLKILNQWKFYVPSRIVDGLQDKTALVCVSAACTLRYQDKTGLV
jgi:hypothetical protein